MDQAEWHGKRCGMNKRVKGPEVRAGSSGGRGERRVCLPCKSRCPSFGLCPVFWILFPRYLLPRPECRRMLELSGEAPERSASSLLTWRDGSQRREPAARSPPAGTQVSAPNLGYFRTRGSVSVRSAPIPALDGAAEPADRRVIGETPGLQAAV